MTGFLSLASFVDRTFANGGSGQELTLFKSILATILLALAIAQATEQALLYGWIPVRNLNRRLVVRLHRIGGATAVAAILLVVGACLYTWLGRHYPLSSARVVAHAVIGGVVLAILLTKAVFANFARQYLKYALPMGIVAGTGLLAIFLLTALQVFLGRI
jgi:Family of unknown function (DUF6529)